MATPPKKPKTVKQLVHDADTWWSRYIRLRDCSYVGGQWMGPCIDGCNRQIVVLNSEGKWQAGSNVGHYISRGRHALRFDDFNCNLQSAYCNAWRDKLDMLKGYKKGLDEKYGSGTATRLRREGEAIHKFTRDELLDIIESCKNYIQYTLENK